MQTPIWSSGRAFRGRWTFSREATVIEPCIDFIPYQCTYRPHIGLASCYTLPFACYSVGLYAYHWNFRGPLSHASIILHATKTVVSITLHDLGMEVSSRIRRIFVLLYWYLPGSTLRRRRSLAAFKNQYALRSVLIWPESLMAKHPKTHYIENYHLWAMAAWWFSPELSQLW